MSDELHVQVGAMVTENQNLRVKSENDDLTIKLMRNQYDSLAAEVDGIHQKYLREIRSLRTERDQAVRNYAIMDTLLMQAADLIMQAARARIGDTTPEMMPHALVPHIEDGRLPGVALS